VVFLVTAGASLLSLSFDAILCREICDQRHVTSPRFRMSELPQSDSGSRTISDIVDFFLKKQCGGFSTLDFRIFCLFT
jgi:hypothetical protein